MSSSDHNRPSANNSTMVLLGEDAEWDHEARVVVHWNKLAPPPYQISLSSKTEEWSSRIKNEFISWAYDLGQFQIEGKSLTSHFKLFGDFSYWWLTSINQKDPFNTPSIYAVFKIRALEMLYFERHCKGLVYCGNNHDLHKTLQGWCAKQNHPYQYIKTALKSNHLKQKGLRHKFKILPYWGQALAWLIRTWLLRYRHTRPSCHKETKNFKSEKQITIVTYFPNMDSEKTRRGEFWSKYWELLHDVLDKSPIPINWVWICFNSKETSFKEAVSLRDTCNQHSPEKYRYYLLEEFLNPKVLLKALKLYIKVYSKGLRLKIPTEAFYFQASKLNFSQLMKHDWNASIFGHFALRNAIMFVLFDEMAKTIPAKPWGIFTWENVWWEPALIEAWRKYQKETKILAHQHTFIRSMDLRYFFDPRVFENARRGLYPFPDKLALNSPQYNSIMGEYFYPEDKYVNVEALRFLHLKGKFGIHRRPLKKSGRTLLVLTGIVSNETQFQLKLLNEAANEDGLNDYNKIIIKPHLGLPLDSLLVALNPVFKYQVYNQSLGDIWAQADVIFAANSTNASIEAAWFGVPLIIAGAVDSLNQNPFFGFLDINFVINKEMLCQQLKNPPLVKISEDFFSLDENLPRWKELLKV